MQLVGKKITEVYPSIQPYILAEDKKRCLVILDNYDGVLGNIQGSTIFLIYSVNRAIVLKAERVERRSCKITSWLYLCLKYRSFPLCDFIDLLDYEQWWYDWALQLRR